jgi:cytoskeletal protein CcmA (bactofilin family)
MQTTDTNKDNIIIGEGVRVSGKVESSGLLEVHGTIEGEARAREVRVGATGRVEGALFADEVDLRGFAGDSVKVEKCLTVRATGTLVGQIVYRSVQIENGASIRGNMDQLDAPPASTSDRSAPAHDAEASDASPLALSAMQLLSSDSNENFADEAKGKA